MEQFLSYFRFDVHETIFIAVFTIMMIIQIFYYLCYYHKPYKFLKKRPRRDVLDKKQPSVSVIIIASDSHEHLEKCLPVILEQDYPDYEVIVVNNGLTDETDMLLKGLKLRYGHLYDTFLPNHSDKESVRKKMASTIGIKAAKNDILLFTEADTVPDSNKWIASMMEEMTENKDIVLGYCYFLKTGKWINRIARFDNLLNSLHYLSSAIRKKPFTGTYRNVAYRKYLFFENKGYSNFLNYDHSEIIFLNSLMNAHNTTVCLNKYSFVCTLLNTKRKWAGIKKYQYKVKKHFRNFRFASKSLFMETFSRYMIYLMLFISILYGLLVNLWAIPVIIGVLFTIRLIIAMVIINKEAKYFKSGKFHFSFIFMELIQPVYNLFFKLKS